MSTSSIPPNGGKYLSWQDQQNASRANDLRDALKSALADLQVQTKSLSISRRTLPGQSR